jgi:hypothetical protein
VSEPASEIRVAVVTDEVLAPTTRTVSAGSKAWELFADRP